MFHRAKFSCHPLSLGTHAGCLAARSGQAPRFPIRLTPTRAEFSRSPVKATHRTAPPGFQQGGFGRRCHRPPTPQRPSPGAGLWSPSCRKAMAPQEHAMLGGAERLKCSGPPPRGWPLPRKTPGPDTDSQAQHKRHEPNSIPRSAGCSLARVVLLPNLQRIQLLKRL